MAVPDYVTIQTSLQTLVTGLNTFANVFIEGSEEEIGNLSNMPVGNIRLTETTSELVRLPNGYNEQATMMLDVIAFDFTSYLTAARLRATLVAGVRTALLATPQFDSQLLTSQLSGNTTYGAYGVEGGRGYVAMATITILCELDVET